MLAIFIAAGGCMPQIINVQPGQEASRAGTEPNRLEPPPGKEQRKSPTERPIAAPTAPIRATTVSSAGPEKIDEKGAAAPSTSAVPETPIQEIASSQTSAAGPMAAPAESHAISGSNDGLSAPWPAVFILAIVAALLLLIGRRSVPNSPHKPLAKLLHTRPWR